MQVETAPKANCAKRLFREGDSMKRFLSIAAALLTAAGLLSACASASRSTAMVAPVTADTLIDASSPLHKSVLVRNVTGGEETNILLQSKVSNADFRTALETSLDLTTMLTTAANAKFLIDAQIISLEQPQLAINLQVITTTRYTVRSFDDRVVFDEEIKTTYKEQFLNSLVRAERQRLANEGSVKANIAEFIKKLVAASEADPAKFAPPS